MRDLSSVALSRRAQGKNVGVRDLKTHAARIMRRVRDEGTSFIVTHRGRAIGVILPLPTDDEASRVADAGDAATAWQTFVRAGHGLERRFRPGVSGVRLLSTTRR